MNNKWIKFGAVGIVGFCLLTPASYAKQSQSYFRYQGALNIPYKINIHYPRFSKGSKYFNINSLMLKKINRFMNWYFGDLALSKIRYSEKSSPRYTISGTYKLWKTRYYAAVKMNLSAYAAGAAYPLGYIETLNYSLIYKRPITLASLFKTNISPNYLGVLSHYTRWYLKRRGITGSTMMEGTARTARNFRAWNLSKMGLVVYFEDGQVGPHAIGQPAVLIKTKYLYKYLSSIGHYYLRLNINNDTGQKPGRYGDE